MGKKWYAVSLVAHSEITQEKEGYYTNKVKVTWAHVATYFSACSEDEANGKALRMCKEVFTESEGYIDHAYHVKEINLRR